MIVIHWLAQNWFDLLQTLGIVASFLFTGASMWVDRKSRRVHNLISITKQNRGIWSELYRRPELARVIDETADPSAHRISPAEHLFVQQLILHLAATWRAMKEGEFMRMEGLEGDIQSFFSLPIPGAVWNKVKHFQEKDFVAFVDGESAKAM